VQGQGILGVMPDFDQIEMKFRIKVEFDVLNKFPKFGCNLLIPMATGLVFVPYHRKFNLYNTSTI